MKILIVGAGITAAVIASELKHAIPSSSAVRVLVWDKARGPGGRMTTSRSPSNPDCHVDIGAQFITLPSSLPENIARVVTDLKKNKLLIPMTAPIVGSDPYSSSDSENLVCPTGVSSLVKHFLSQSAVEVFSQRRVTKLEGKGNTVTVHYEETSQQPPKVTSEDGFNSVILTMPIPQIHQLNYENFNPHKLEELSNQFPGLYSSRFALALFFPDNSDLGLDFGFKFLEDDIIRWVAVDNVKRGEPSKPAAFIAHSSWQFGRDFIDRDAKEAEEIMLLKIYDLFPTLPKTSERKIHKWRFSQLRSDSERSDGPGYFLLNEKAPLIICAGDGFTNSSFLGCVQSALSTSSVIKSALLSEI